MTAEDVEGIGGHSGPMAIRHRQLGEGKYDSAERMIQQLLSESDNKTRGASELSTVDAPGPQATDLQSPETYIGYVAPGANHGSDVDANGVGSVEESGPYQLIRQVGPIRRPYIRGRIPRSRRASVCIHVRIAKTV